MNFRTYCSPLTHNGFQRSFGKQSFLSSHLSIICPESDESSCTESQIPVQNLRYFNKSQQQNYSDYPIYYQQQPPYYYHHYQQLQLRRVSELDYSFETFFGFIKDKNDAMLIVEACVHGRLKCIPPYKYSNLNFRSGSIVVITQKSYDTSSIRWRDGGNWTTSKLNDGFLLYRETEPIPEGFSFPQFQIEAVPLFAAGSLKANTQLIPDGMAKRTISLTGSDGNRYRVISYFYPIDVESHYICAQIQQRQSFLKTPAEIPEFAVFGRQLSQSTVWERENSNGSVGEVNATVTHIPISTTTTEEELSQSIIPHQQNEYSRLHSNSACKCGAIQRLGNAMRYDLLDCDAWFRQPVYLARIRRIPTQNEEDNLFIAISQQPDNNKQ
ncbi:hypothetical protein HK100_005134 [Physocladia obscura]|uniref:Uncharacterized protein n=1 Tax=Physocladia obscura TaxID=109957 RepID=A0AAD5SXP1_9FUNG|nr:hypothetical protein HK100_005134 [Physocladia obscura]